jgi:DNA polymerase I-like protein with 3'-5' exonuclease and polymerase domains
MTTELVFNQTESDWKRPESYPDLSDRSIIAVDLETRDPNIKTKGPGWATKDGEVVGIAVAADGFKGYFPIAHEAGGNMDKAMTLKWYKKLMENGVDKVCHNASYDIGWTKSLGIKPTGKIYDTMIAGALINEDRFSYSLNALSFDYLGEVKSEAQLREKAEEWGLDAKADMWRLPAGYVGPYAEQDAELTLKLWNRFKIEIQQQNLSNIFNLETELQPILIEMREHGIKVDVSKADSLKKNFIQEENKRLKQIKDMSGHDVEIWAAVSVAKAFDKLKIPYERTAKTKAPSFTTNWLHNCPHPLAKFIRETREMNKFHSTFIDSILRYEHNGRIHAEINQLKSDSGGTATGRLSMSNPNLQQIPARNKEFGKHIRALFLPDDGKKWGSFDYSQQEPRLVVHYASSVDQGFEGSYELLKAYENDDADFHQVVAEMADIPRSQAKTINLGMFYGMGKAKLSAELGIDIEQAKAILNAYNERVPFVKMLSNRCMTTADKKGCVVTIKGRHCRFDRWEPKTFGIHKSMTREEAESKYERGSIKRAMTYKALNRLIQGSAADQTKQAMINCYNTGHRPLLQIHDELCFNISKETDIEEIKQQMEHCLDDVPLKVPSKVDLAMGINWGEAT